MMAAPIACIYCGNGPYKTCLCPAATEQRAIDADRLAADRERREYADFERLAKKYGRAPTS